MNIKNTPNFLQDDLAQLLENSLCKQPKEGQIVKGKVVTISEDAVYIDVGLKSEGKISINEFKSTDLKIGDEIDVYVDRFEGKNGCTQLSREKVAKELSWNKFEELNASNSSINGKIIGKVNKGGFAVDIEGILAFLPGSQLDIRPIKDPSTLINIEQDFKILKIDRAQGNVVVSRRAILEESRKEAKNALLAEMKEGMIFSGVVKNITNYGAFIDLGDIDGLLHITDISWDKISHPSEKISLGQELKVVVTKYHAEAQRISLGLKQLTENPWKGLETKYTIGSKHSGKIASISDYGVFVELEPSIEGLVYLNEIDWNVKNTHPTKLVSIGDEVEIMILDIEINKHRISLSIKQCMPNPWKDFIEKYPIGTKVHATVKKIVDFGMFVNIIDDKVENNLNKLDLLIPAIEISWNDNPKNTLKNFNVDDKVKGIILNSDLTRERVTVSIKQLEETTYKETVSKLIKNNTITCKVVDVNNNEGIHVTVDDGEHTIKGFIRKYDLSKHKDQQKPDRFTIGDKVDAKIINYDRNKKTLHLSVKLLEIAEEKKAIAEYGSIDSGASLGDILGAAIKEQTKKN